MSVWQRVTSEIKTIGLVTLYFAICFGVMIFLKRLVLAAHQIEFRGLSIAIVGALIVAKVVAVMEHVPLGRRRPLRPDPRVLPRQRSSPRSLDAEPLAAWDARCRASCAR